MKTINSIKVFAAMILLSITMVACDTGVKEVDTVVNTATQTVTVASDMIDNTVNNGCGAFTATLTECK